MNIGLVILNYKSLDLTKSIVAKCVNYNIFDHIVVVDNNSGDNCRPLEDISSIIHVVNRTQNSGYAIGNNEGFRLLYEVYKCDIAFLSNPDVIFEKKVIENISNFLINNEDYCVVSSKRSDSSYEEHALQFWERPKFCECLLESFYLYRRIKYKKRRLRSCELIDKCSNYFIDVDVVPGAFFGVDLNKFARIGYLDENTFLWYEENCLSWKCKYNNYKQCLLLNCSYYHNHTSHGRGNKLFFRYNQSKKYYCKNYLQINYVQYIILSIFTFYSNIEQKVLNFLGKFKKD